MPGKRLSALTTVAALLVFNGSVTEPALAQNQKQVLAKVCSAHVCKGRMQRVEIWGDAGGRIRRYLHYGDITVCSHPPLIVFDAEGNEIGSLDERPLVPGSAEARAAQEAHRRLTGGARLLRAAECPMAER
jgi:hypothetical protein